MEENNDSNVDGNILYDLSVHAEWPAEAETIVSKIINEARVEYSLYVT